MGGLCAVWRLGGIVIPSMLTTAEYTALRFRAVQYCRKPGIPDPESLVDEAIARLIATPHDVDNPVAFLLAICRNVLFEEYRRLEAVRALANSAPGPEVSSTGDDDSEYKACLAALPRSERLLLEAYVGSGVKGIERRRRLAVRLGISDDALRQRIHRMREKLQRCLADRRAGVRHA